MRRWLTAAIMLAALARVSPGLAAGAEALPEVLDVGAAAALLRVEPALVRSMAEAQAIPARRVGDDWRFARDALLEWLKGARFAGMAIVPPGRSETAGMAPAASAPRPEPAAGAAPATLGERPAAPTAGEMALRDQRVLLARGAASMDLGFSYARSEQTLYPILRVEQNAASASATLRYGLRDELQLTARLPGTYHRSAGFVDASVAGAVAPINKSESYLGDATVSLLGVAVREATGRPNAIWSVDAVLPSGPGDRGIGGGMVLSKSYDPAVLFAGASYLYGVSTDPAASRRSLARHNVGLNLGYTYAVNDTLALNTVLTGTYRTTRSADGFAPPPARERYQLQFGMTWMLAPGLFLEPAIGVRLGGDSPDFLFSLNLPYSL
jgi:excisionase family DNA binding protein